MAEDVRKRFQDAGFEVAGSSAGPLSFDVKKSNCQWTIEHGAAGGWTTSGPPYFNVRGTNCELEDRGYQKFWYHEGERFPIRLKDLRAFHQFIEEVRAVLREAELYNQSLGSTCARTVYDRLDGRADR